MNLKGKRFRIHHEERKRTYNLKSSFKHQEVLAIYAEKYQELGRGLVALQAQVATSHLDVPIELSLDNTRSDGIENYGGRSRELEARTDRPGPLKRRLR